MLKRGLVLVMSFALVSSAFAGATVDFMVTDFGNTPCNGQDGCVFGDSGANPDGTFNGGESILVHVMLTTDASFFIRGAQIDWRASSPELGLGQDIDTVGDPKGYVPDDVPNFWFDYSSILAGGIIAQGTYPASGRVAFGLTTGSYADFSNLQQGEPLNDFVAATTWPLLTGDPIGQLQVTAGVPYRLGGMPVTLPTEPGVYTLDVLNLAITDDANFGMVLDFGFGGPGDAVTKWASASGDPNVNDTITYNPGRDHLQGGLQLVVIPEPATLVLLGLGGLAAVRRRRK